MNQRVRDGDVSSRGGPVLHQQAGRGGLIKSAERVSQAGQGGRGGERAAGAEHGSRRDQALSSLGQSAQA
jgi:hypothetical protein